MHDLAALSGLLRERNQIEQGIASLIGRPAHSGHIAEYIAALVMEIELHQSASAKGSDGRFRAGPLQNRTVDIKFKSRNDGLLDISMSGLPDYYLVLSGPWTPAASSRGTTAPWILSHLYLFETSGLLGELRRRSVKIGTATSVVRHIWEEAEIYPVGRNPEMALTENQRQQLSLFRG